ncbi:uncharacterized protein LOC143040468 [Oratosquilla oratoria]|uniref:uncharacterized protein LOC143040468 n=1 Tax=Oratosquilla oratoria TaxID=337810 RepID=UPI003F776AC9
MIITRIPEQCRFHMAGEFLPQTSQYKIRNDKIRETLGVESILKFIDESQLQYYGHIIRRNPENKIRRALECHPDGVHPIGRPRRRWLDNIRELIIRRGTTYSQIKDEELFLNRNAWRGFVLTERQPEGLPMGSPLSAVAACPFLETLEQEEYMNIIPNDSMWYRYVDDCLIVLHKDTNICDFISRLNHGHPKIQLTIEHETFKKHSLSVGLLSGALKKAKAVRESNNDKEKDTKNSMYIVVPTSDLACPFSKELRHTDIYISCDAGYDSAYIGQTYRGLFTRLKEHRADAKYHCNTNAFVRIRDRANDARTDRVSDTVGDDKGISCVTETRIMATTAKATVTTTTE